MIGFPKPRARVLDRIKQKRDLAKHKHHTVYRSRGGSWDTKQIVSACPLHHRWIHDGLIELHGNPDKPPMRVLLTALGRAAKMSISQRGAA